MQPGIDNPRAANAEWVRIMRGRLATAGAFEIHCWADELEWCDALMPFGAPRQSDWSGGRVMSGKVTPAFIDYLLGLPKPDDTAVYDKMTPFFSIFLDNGFSSEHYGTELNHT